MKFKIAVVQFKITPQNPKRNFERVEKFIQQAVEKNANVIIFPEDCITGSIFGDRTKLDHDFSYRNTFQQLAKKYRIDIVAGSFMEGAPRGAFSTSYYIDSRGKVLAGYQKTNLYHSERYFLNPGTEVAVFDTKYGKAGIVICWDIMFPELFRRMMRLGVQIVYCPSYWYEEIAGEGCKIYSKSQQNLIDAISVARATENNIVFVYANAAGKTVNPNKSIDILIGHSQIVTPFAGALAKCSHNREAMFIQEVDTSILTLSDKAYRFREDIFGRIV
jgi:predicted amidohydrolase